MRFVITGTPVAKGRPRSGMYGMYTPKKTQMYEKHVKECFKKAGGEMFPEGVPLYCYLHVAMPIPSSWSKKKRLASEGAFHTSKPDLDNIIKAVLDGLNGAAYADDSAIVQIVAAKKYSSEPGVTVTLEVFDGRKEEDLCE